MNDSDPDGDPTYWSLVTAPWGLSIDPNLGTLRWLPGQIQIGPQNVTVQLVDNFGAKATQSWTITVKDGEGVGFIWFGNLNP